mgnify:CR=1 FL=1
MRTGDLSLEGYRRAALNGDVVAVMEEVTEGKVLTGMDERADKVRRGMDEIKVRPGDGVVIVFFAAPVD